MESCGARIVNHVAVGWTAEITEVSRYLSVNGTFDVSGRVRWEVFGELGHPECMAHRNWLSMWVAVVVLASLSACSYVPPVEAAIELRRAVLVPYPRPTV